METIYTARKSELGADYLNPTINPKALRAHGFTVAFRYLKNTSRDEVAAIHAAGLGLVMIFESSATRPLDGAQAGAADGMIAKAQAEVLGYPHGFPIVVAIDLDVVKSNLTACVAYWRAFKRALAGAYGCGCYGDYDMLDVVGAESTLNVQPNAAGWSWLRIFTHWFKRTHPTAHLRQQAQTTIAGVGTIDPDLTLLPFGAWAGSAPDPVPPQIITPEAIMAGENRWVRIIESDTDWTPHDLAQFVQSGMNFTWIPTSAIRNRLVSDGYLATNSGTPFLIKRADLALFNLVGPQPVYGADTVWHTSGGAFASWIHA
jgi:hypothetical protein